MTRLSHDYIVEEIQDLIGDPASEVATLAHWQETRDNTYASFNAPVADEIARIVSGNIEVINSYELRIPK